MSEYNSPYSLSGFESYGQDFKKQPQSLDFFSFHTPSDILAPHPDLFESELDSSLAAFDEVQLNLITVDSNDAFSFLRSDTPTCGPPSTITVSSESAYDSLSSRSESYYNYPSSPYSQTNYSFPIDIEMQFERIRVDGVPDYVSAARHTSLSSTTSINGSVDPSSFGPLPPTPPRSPQVPVHTANSGYQQQQHGRSYSDYGASSRGHHTASMDYYSQYAGTLAQPTVAPNTVSPRASDVPSLSSVRHNNRIDDAPEDSRRRYKCPACPRAFARAYNLKTHMTTHDPNRPKPHVCPHRSCGRSFSRKHDLGRHLVSIHQESSVTSTQHSNVVMRKAPIGVDGAHRGWCEACGKGWVGKIKNCGCEVK